MIKANFTVPRNAKWKRETLSSIELNRRVVFGQTILTQNLLKQPHILVPFSNNGTFWYLKFINIIRSSYRSRRLRHRLTMKHRIYFTWNCTRATLPYQQNTRVRNERENKKNHTHFLKTMLFQWTLYLYTLDFKSLFMSANDFTRCVANVSLSPSVSVYCC